MIDLAAALVLGLLTGAALALWLGRRRAASTQRDRPGVQEIAELSGDWVWESDREHRFTAFHGGGAGAIAFPPKGVIGRTRWAVAGADPASDPRWAAHKADLDAHRPFRLFRYAWTTPEGAERHAAVSGKPVFDAAGGFLGYRGIATDETSLVDARRRAEQAEALLRDAIESIAEGIVIYDDEDRLVMCNQAYLSFYPENARRSLIGSRFGDILREGIAKGRFPDAVGREEAWVTERIRRHREDRNTIEQQVGDGRWVLVTKRRMANGWIVGLRVEVTALKAAQAALVESEGRLSAVMDSSVDGLITIREDGTVTSFSRPAERIFGYAAAEVIGRNVKLLMPEPYHGEHDGYLAAYRRTGEARIIGNGREVVGRRKDGSTFPMDLAVGELPARGGAREFVGTVRDISARVSTEAQLRQAQKMEAIGNLTGGVAHDFNNLLTVIMGSVETVADALADRPALKTGLDRAIVAVERGATLARSLLAFARKQPLSPVAVDLNRLVRDLHDLLARTLGETIEIEAVAAAGLWQCEVDAGQLQNALVNLAINARDAMPAGGKLTIDTANVRLDQAYADQHEEVTPGDYVMLAVSDTGTGMPPEVVARAFEPFFSTKPSGRGSGLGLSMVYGFVKQSGGHISVYSELGLGSSIRLYLPRSREAAAEPGAGAEPGLPLGGGERVLMVEDDADVRVVTLAQLQALGYPTQAAANAAEALRLIGEQEFDLLITDVVLAGGVNGRELAERATRRQPGLKVLFMSGYTENAIFHHGRLDPGVELLAKPFRARDLAAKVRAVLDRDRSD